jgi:hypothetical protein
MTLFGDLQRIGEESHSRPLSRENKALEGSVAISTICVRDCFCRLHDLFVSNFDNT